MGSRTCSPLDCVAPCDALKNLLRLYDDDDDDIHLFVLNVFLMYFTLHSAHRPEGFVILGDILRERSNQEFSRCRGSMNLTLEVWLDIQGNFEYGTHWRLCRRKGGG